MIVGISRQQLPFMLPRLIWLLERKLSLPLVPCDFFATILCRLSRLLEPRAQIVRPLVLLTHTGTITGRNEDEKVRATNALALLTFLQFTIFLSTICICPNRSGTFRELEKMAEMAA